MNHSFLLRSAFLFIFVYLFHPHLLSAQTKTSKDATNTELVAKIAVPTDGALVRGDVPIYGLAYGQNFYEYVLEYGIGNNPEQWLLIQSSSEERRDIKGLEDVNFDLVKTVSGNLGMWTTGLTEYVYADSPVDLPMGLHTLRLRVKDRSGRIAEDRVEIEVGRVILNCCENTVISPDQKVTLLIPEHSLPDVAKVVAIDSLSSLPKNLKDNKDLKLISRLYQLRPAGLGFSQEVKLEIFADEETKKNSWKAGICIYDPSTKKWQYQLTYFDQLRNSYFVKLKNIPDQLAIFGLFESSKILNTVSDHAESFLSKTRKMMLVNNTFDDKLHQWENKFDDNGGVLSIVDQDCINGKCLKIENAGDGSNLGVAVFSKSFDARIYSILEFDYKIDAAVKVNFLLKVGKKWYDIIFTDDEKNYWDIDMERIGKIDGVKTDGEWHHVVVNIKKMLESVTEQHIIEEIELADWDATGFKRLEFGKGLKESHFFLDNFKIRSDKYFWFMDRTESERDNNEVEKDIKEGAQLPRFLKEKLKISFKAPEFINGQPYILSLEFVDEADRHEILRDNIEFYYQGEKLNEKQIYQKKNGLNVLLRNLEPGENNVVITNKSENFVLDSISLVYLSDLPITIDKIRSGSNKFFAVTPLSLEKSEPLESLENDEIIVAFYIKGSMQPLSILINPEKTNESSLWFDQRNLSVSINSKSLKEITYGADAKSLKFQIPIDYLNAGMNFIKIKNSSTLKHFGIKEIQIKEASGDKESTKSHLD